jgi:arylsulfatase A-like enzyme
MGDAQVVDWALSELNRKQSKPLFLGCGLFRPHLPWHVPGKYFDLFPLNDIIVPQVPPDDLDDIPTIGIKFAKPNGDHASITGHHKWKEAVQGYLASIAFMDAQLGRLIDGFDRSPRARDTHIVLWSDHGWHLGEKLHWRKMTLWEEATRVPYFWIVPGLTKPDTVCDRPVDLMSIYPTLMELTGLPTPSHVEGLSIRPLLADPKAEWKHPALTTYLFNNHAVRSDRWRYIRYADGGEELYDEVADPQEWKNLAGNAELAKVKAELAKYLPKVNAPPGPAVEGAPDG